MDSIPVILVADDDPNGHEAIRYPEGLPPYDNRQDFPVPGLVLLDLKMPLMNGFDVLEWLKGRPELEGLPALVLSSSAHEGDVCRAKDLGSRAYHVKPSELSQLIDLAQELNSKWLMGRVQPRSAGITASSGPSH